MTVTLGDEDPSYCTAKNFVASFRTGHLSPEDEERSETPTQMTIPENLDTFRITEFLDFAHRSEFQILGNTTFRKLDLFASSGEWRETPTLFDP
jgi:hypothetical protein